MRNLTLVLFVSALAGMMACDTKDDDDPVAPDPTTSPTPTPTPTPTPIGSGTLDPAFGTGGAVTSTPSTGHAEITCSALADGFLYAGGVDYAPGVTDLQWRIEKRNWITGNLALAFGLGGVVTVNPNAGLDILYGIVVDAAGGALYAVGSDFSVGGAAQWRIEKRDLATGALVAAFGTAGVVTSNATGAHEAPRTVTIDATGLYVGGFDYSIGVGNAQWRIEKRDLATGALIPGFGTAGVVLNNPSAQDDHVMCLLQVGAFLFVGGFDNVLGNNQARLEKRLAADGSLQGAFGAAGVVTYDNGGAQDKYLALAYDGFSVFAYISSNSPNAKIQKLDVTNGAPSAGFGTGGTQGLTLFASQASSVTLAAPLDLTGTTIFVGGSYDLGGGDKGFQVEARDTTAGALVASWGTAGIATSNPGALVDGIQRLEADSHRVYALGGTSANAGADWSWVIESRGR